MPRLWLARLVERHRNRNLLLARKDPSHLQQAPVWRLESIALRPFLHYLQKGEGNNPWEWGAKIRQARSKICWFEARKCCLNMTCWRNLMAVAAWNSPKHPYVMRFEGVLSLRLTMCLCMQGGALDWIFKCVPSWWLGNGAACLPDKYVYLLIGVAVLCVLDWKRCPKIPWVKPTQPSTQSFWHLPC